MLKKPWYRLAHKFNASNHINCCSNTEHIPIDMNESKHISKGHRCDQYLLYVSFIDVFFKGIDPAYASL